MIQSLENEYVKLSFDSKINNIIELRNKLTNDNYVKSNQKGSILALWCILKEKGIREKFIPTGVTGLKVDSNESSTKLSITYNGFMGDGKILDINAEVNVKICGEKMLQWTVCIENRHSGCDIVEILFPHIRGIYLGESWEDDIIIYPHHAGEKTINPICEYASERYKNFGRASSRFEAGVYSREINYCGLASMMWMYYYDKNNGFYISSNDRNYLVTGMLAETGGTEDPWMGFGIRKYKKIECGQTWFSEPCTMAVNCEDWHWGAKEYRKWIDPFIKTDNNPAHLKNEFVLNQCYNFKKDGSIHNRFDKIPELFLEGKKLNIRHMFIASWNRKGFDCNYPEYYPDMELGTSMDLYESCQYVNNNNGFITFYINSRLFDIESDFFPTIGHDMAIKKINGEYYTEKYGPVTFAIMCPSDTKWQKQLIDTACWMIKSYGATGIYLDQLGSAEPFPCFESSHSHADIGGFNTGYLKILKDLKEKISEMNSESFLMIENCGDIYGSYVWGSLTWNGEQYDEYFNIFKYTFPEFVQINMVNPRSKKSGNERIELFYSHMERALLLGSVLWLGITDHFRKDEEELRTYAEKAVEFRRKINPMIRDGVYMDDVGIVNKSPCINASRWKLGDGNELIIVGNKNCIAGCRICVEITQPVSIFSEDIDGNSHNLKYEYNAGCIEVYLPESRVIYLLICE
jgi:hypothetical protein